MKKNNVISSENWNIKLNNVRKEHRDSLNDIHNKNLTKRKIIIESLEDEHNLLTKSKIQEINDLKDNFNDQKDKELSFLKEQNETLKQEFNILHDKEILFYKEEQTQNANTIQKKLDELININSYKNNTEKGNHGELIVSNLLKTLFPKAEIVDTSKENHRGDIKFCYNDLKCMIEVKNVNTIQKERDINKFITDIRTCKEIINSDLFISLGTENIPYKGPYHFEKTGNIPTYYVFGHERNIYCSIKELILKVQENKKTSKNEQKLFVDGFRNETKNVFGEDITFYTKQLKINNDLKRYHNECIKKLNNQEQTFEKKLRSINGYFNTYQDMEKTYTYKDSQNKLYRHDEHKKLSKDEMKILEKWIIDTKKIPTKKKAQEILKISDYDWVKRLINWKYIRSQIAQIAKA